MNKLQRNIDGQVLEFVSLPRIFTSLAQDLPSGSIDLGNGEVAYYRIHRNLKELKNKRKEMKQLVDKLVGALKSIVESDQFATHYGVKKAPRLDKGNRTLIAMRTILLQNLKTVEYKATDYGRGRPLVEHVTVPLGNMAFFNAVRGMRKFEPTNGELVGKFYLNGDDGEDKAFDFWIRSPFIDLSNHIGPEGLAEEILAKIRTSLHRMSDRPRIVFDDKQFEGFRQLGLQDLATRPAHQGKNKKQAKSEQSRNDTKHLTDSETNTERLEASVSQINKAASPSDVTEGGIVRPVFEDYNCVTESIKTDIVIDSVLLGDEIVVNKPNGKQASVVIDVISPQHGVVCGKDKDGAKYVFDTIDAPVQQEDQTDPADEPENTLPVLAYTIAADINTMRVGDTLQYMDDNASTTAVVESVNPDQALVHARRADGRQVQFTIYSVAETEDQPKEQTFVAEGDLAADSPDTLSNIIDNVIATRINSPANEERDPSTIVPIENAYSGITEIIPITIDIETVKVGDTIQYQDGGESVTAVVELVQLDKSLICAKRADGRAVIFVAEGGLAADEVDEVQTAHG